MKQYMLGIYQSEGGVPPAPDELAEIMRELEVVNDEMRAAGAWVFASGLNAPSTATVLRATGNDVLITDGPYVESKEYIAGFSIIRAADLDEALKWGSKVAVVLGLPIEIRPLEDG
ncbi:YciI family protein [Nocardia sp. KC 131]|uniref:YciI family protein n=1 Tax=Nocardia arseniciresistens TaxID=3392119 RepID=UPI00398E4F36